MNNEARFSPAALFKRFSFPGIEVLISEDPHCSSGVTIIVARRGSEYD